MLEEQRLMFFKVFSEKNIICSSNQPDAPPPIHYTRVAGRKY